MVIKRSSAAEVTRLVSRLLDSDALAREAASARLAILGPRAVDRLHTALVRAWGESQMAAVLDVLERIGDPRSLDVAEPLLSDRREAVATSAVAVTRRMLAAVDAGIAARATDLLIGVALDDERSPALRQAAVTALQDLPPDVLGPFQDRFPLPAPVPAPEKPDDAPEPAPSVILESWIAATRALSAEQLTGLVLRAGATLPIPQLHRVIERARALESDAANAEAAGGWRQLRGCVHQVLGERDSRVALYDLRETLERSHGANLTVGMLAALARVADAACLDPLAEAWARTEDAWTRSSLRAALEGLVAREGLTQRHTSARRLVARHPTLADLFSRPSRKKPAVPPPARK